MSRWIPVPPPDAPLEPVDRAEVPEDNGDITRVFRTTRGVRFVKIVEPSGFVYWMQEVA